MQNSIHIVLVVLESIEDAIVKITATLVVGLLSITIVQTMNKA